MYMCMYACVHVCVCVQNKYTAHIVPYLGYMLRNGGVKYLSGSREDRLINCLNILYTYLAQQTYAALSRSEC